MEFLDLFNSQHGIIAVLVGIAWRYFTGSKRDALEKRIKEAAFIGWQAAKAITGLEAKDLHGAAHQWAVKQLYKLNLGALTEQAILLLDHELELLEAQDALQGLPTAIGKLGDAAERVLDKFTPPANPTVPRLELELTESKDE